LPATPGQYAPGVLEHIVETAAPQKLDRRDTSMCAEADGDHGFFAITLQSVYSGTQLSEGTFT